MNDLFYFLLLAVFLGPVGSVSFGLEILSPLEVFIILTLLYTLPIPVIFKLFECGGHHRRIYRNRIYRKAARVTGRRMDELLNQGDKIITLFKDNLGQLGLYLTIVLFTLIFGIFWASLFSYLLLVKRKRAIASMAVGVMVGNIFWIVFALYSKNLIKPLEMALLALLVPVWMYGIKREIEILRKIAARLNLHRKKV
ncbi:MAG: small multi-drug export protein [Candidatus Altiarchaeota archaeon]|nr:small multi-drug export protein [Candidatus Altiarchaeota archaeon]